MTKKPLFRIKRAATPKIRRSGAVKLSMPTHSKVDLRTSIARFHRAMDQVKSVVLERDDEVSALSLCILTGQHMMLEGPHGIAKSMLAREVTRRITGSTLFEKQFMAGTNADEVFGPMNVKAYREDGLYEHNIEGYLPSAHFFFADEVYRAGASMLGSLMGVLNERTYHNGNVVLRCPLISAIGTTNFITETDELAAFHDRWLVTSLVKPLSQRHLRCRMLSDFHKRLIAEEAEGEESAPELATVSLSDIQNIRAHISEIDVQPEILDLFEELVRSVAKAKGNLYISDRRACLVFNTVLMSALQDLGNQGMTLMPEHLDAAKFGLVKLNDTAGAQAFEQTYERIVGTYERNAEEISKAKLTLKRAQKMCELFDSKLVKNHLRKLYVRINDMHDAILGMDGDDAPTLDSTKEMYAEATTKLKEVMLEIEEMPKMSETVRDYKAGKVDAMAEAEENGTPVSAFSDTSVPDDPNKDGEAENDDGGNPLSRLFKSSPKKAKKVKDEDGNSPTPET